MASKLGAAHRQDFMLKPLKDFVRQLPGDTIIGALPDATPEDATMKAIVQNNCTGCHTPSYILQHKFDEAGWNAIINLKKGQCLRDLSGAGPPAEPRART